MTKALGDSRLQWELGLSRWCCPAWASLYSTREWPGQRWTPGRACSKFNLLVSQVSNTLTRDWQAEENGPCGRDPLSTEPPAHASQWGPCCSGARSGLGAQCCWLDRRPWGGCGVGGPRALSWGPGWPSGWCERVEGAGRAVGRSAGGSGLCGPLRRALGSSVSHCDVRLCVQRS